MNIKIDENKIKVIKLQDENYPEKLRNIYNPPKELYILGNEKLLNEKAIAVVGCRACSDYGRKVSFEISKQLNKHDIVVISGFAKGIDSYAHKGAIYENGKTIAVLGCGLDVIYPAENKELYMQILKAKGVIITEYPIGTRPLKQNFPARNRIISGLSDGVLVVEARKRSGTLITVEHALEQGKDVYAVPRQYF